MGQGNAERLRVFLQAWSDAPWTREDLRRDGLGDMSIFHPDVVYEDANLPDHAGEPYRGLGGIARATERWIEPFAWMRLELERIADGGEKVVSIHRWRAQARHTGIEFDAQLAYLWEFHGGQVIHFRSYIDPQAALRAAGLAHP